MNKKDYIKLANALKRVRPDGGTHTTMAMWAACVGAVAEELRLDNPNFNKVVFISHATKQEMQL